MVNKWLLIIISDDGEIKRFKIAWAFHAVLTHPVIAALDHPLSALAERGIDTLIIKLPSLRSREG